jgi:hypothetical protein
MIPEHWETVRRPDDGEVVGYLAADGGADVVPMTLVGSALGAPGPAADARAVLLARGLAVLDRRWWCRLPSPLPRGLLHVARPAPEWEWRPVVVVEAAPDGVRIRPEWPDPVEVGGQAALPVPVGDLLREQPPA